MQLVKNRQLARRGSKPSELGTMHLEEVRDYLGRLQALQQPQNMERSFSQMHVSYTDGKVTGQMLGINGLEGEAMPIHSNAYKQMSSTLLPARFGSGLLQQAHLGETGEKLSTMSFALWAAQSDKPRMFRTVETSGDGRIIRSQHSQSYAVYDDHQFVSDLMDNAPELAKMPVVDFHVTDLGMRLRFLTEDVGAVELRKAMPIIEARNSGAGCKATTLNAGIWKLICTNGMAHWDSKTSYRWRHFGNTERIREGVGDAIEEIRVSASGVVSAYNKALDTSIDDAFAFLERELKREGVGKMRIAEVQAALTDPTTTEGFNLASAVDAMTLVAQRQEMFEQTDLEQIASRILNRGLAA